jgi:hypothetical protein
VRITGDGILMRAAPANVLPSEAKRRHTKTESVQPKKTRTNYRCLIKEVEMYCGQDDIRSDIKQWIIETDSSKPPEIDSRQLNEALYAFEYAWAWPDQVDNVSEEQAILIWKIIERVRKEGYPDELRV